MHFHRNPRCVAVATRHFLIDNNATMKIPYNLWHPVLLSKELRAKPSKFRRFGLDFVFWRDAQGQPHAFPDRCPHLGASLSQGSVVHGKLVCPFHGFEFDSSGQCAHIPANGVSGKIPAGMECDHFDCVEQYGFIWLWMGDAPATGSPAYFAEIAAGFQTYDSVVEAPVNYSRAIENQLDCAHLPFVHKTTIGAGGRSFVDGPYVEEFENGINTWVFNRIDSGDAQLSQSELRARAAAIVPSLQLLFPSLWLLNISENFKNFIAFVPVDERTTRFYMRACHKVSVPLMRQLYELVLGLSNKFILGQDLRIIANITPQFSLDSTSDRLIGADRAIVAYRRWLAKHALEIGSVGKKIIPIETSEK